jgi:DNA-binding MarR family transcriptional regulator/N-acetylglutamate synthase-like GNAT family acetyltransferase
VTRSDPSSRTEPSLPIEKVRDSSRRLVRELGFMKPTVGATGLPISAVHALIEIGSADGRLTAAELGDLLTLEKSSVSRMLRKLVERGEVQERENPRDARSKLLSLTRLGAAMLDRINDLGRGQVSGAFAHLSADRRNLVIAGLETYADALRAARLDANSGDPAGAVEIVAGYMPGVIGWIAGMHGSAYVEPYGFGRFFEAKVAREAAEFSERIERSMNELWVARLDGGIVGTVAIDGEKFEGGSARLRWFLVDAAARGLGIGRKLLAEAVGFCDRQGFAAIDLWTLRGLDAARRLYEDFGFALVEEFEGDQWGTRVTEQRFRRAAVGR